jgi:putative addiction module component (TIGR02574 family)
MTKAAAAVLADALRLSDDARAELAAELLASLDGPEDADAQQAWETEIGRRIDAIEAGRIPLEPWDVVRQRIGRDLLGRWSPSNIAAPASREFAEAVRWYESKRSGLGGEFYDAVVDAIALLQQYPGAGREVEGPPPHRQMLVERFPYHIPRAC